ncbi:MAG: hypothetical protein LBI87_04540, partial [Candidatus Accumulibacter sp.]|nr:hypothetical protein [Accumulibacter sp.]
MARKHPARQFKNRGAARRSVRFRIPAFTEMTEFYRHSIQKRSNGLAFASIGSFLRFVGVRFARRNPCGLWISSFIARFPPTRP